MRTVLAIVIFALCTYVAPAAARPGDEPLEEREALFTAIAGGNIGGEELLQLQLEQLKAELYYIQLEVERFSVDESVGRLPEDTRYPHSLNQLVVETWSDNLGRGVAYARPGLYPNPYTASGPEDLNALCVPLGWSELHPGNFSYLTQLDELGNVVGYTIVGYSPAPDMGHDINGDGIPDGVVITLSSGAYPLEQSGAWFDHGSFISYKIFDWPAARMERGLLDPQLESTELLKARDAQLKQSLHGVQLALERYGVDNPQGRYPQDLSLLVYPGVDGYTGSESPYLPGGKFFGNTYSVDDASSAARCIPFGWTPDAAGNFSYLTQYDDADKVTGYALVGYGPVKNDGLDIDGDGIGDGIVIILWSGREYDLPPLESGIYEYYNCGRIVSLPYERPQSKQLQ